MKIFNGEVHAHTDFSDGRGTPPEAYDYARNVGKVDYFSVTDHNGPKLTDEKFFSVMPSLAEEKNEDGKFAALYGYEMTYGAGKYVNTVKLCGSNIKGRLVREGLLQSKIRSSAFEVEYDSSAKEFIFTTYGYGHGVGMSQLGANYYAKQGWTYDEILEHYYSGAVVK